jgi:MSHA biogenesis protein MshK
LDEAVKTLTASTLAAIALASSFASQRALAEQLLDPTRPPAALGVRAEGSGAPNAGDGLPRLQSILISPRPNGRQVAVIDGETVRLGDSYKGARVARMTQTEVELVRGRERQVLRLEPAGSAGGGISPAN